MPSSAASAENLRLGRQCIGIEIDQRHHRTATMQLAAMKLLSA
jgi:hypothetical protein